MPYDYENPFDPQQEAAKRDEFLNRIKNWWNNTFPPVSPQNEEILRNRYQGAGSTFFHPETAPVQRYLQGVGGQPQPQQQAPPPPPPEPTQVARPQYTPDYGYTPPEPPPMAPQGPPPGPPPPQPQQAPQMAGTPGVDPVAYMQQQEEAKRQKHMQMVQFVNAIMGQQQGEDKGPSRREKIAQALLPLSAMLTQFGGAMMTPYWARGQMMANMGNIIPEYMMAQAKQKAAREDKREQRQAQLLGHLLPIAMKEEKEPTPHFLVGKDGKVQIFPGPITQEKQELQAKSFQAAAVDAYNKGDTATGDWYSNKANEIARQNVELHRQTVQQGWERLNRPTTLYDTEQDELIQAPPGTRPLPRQRQQGAGLTAREITEEGQPQRQGGVKPPAQPPRPPRPGMKWQWMPD